MAVSVGKIESFDPSNEEGWTHYIERLEYYFLANRIQGADKKRAVLISVMGPQAYKLLRSLIAPAMPNEKTFQQLVDILQGHYNPRPLEIMQRFYFNSRVRQAGESVATYLASLRALAQHCKFEGTLEAMLRDRLVVGVDDIVLQRRLLAEPRLTLKKAMEIALAHETALKNAKAIQGANGNPQVVNQVTDVKSTTATATKPACYRCGKSNHKAQDCYYKEAVCSHCKKKGHLAKACRNRTSTKLPTATTKKRQSQSTNFLDSTQDDVKEPSEYALFTVNTCRGSASNLFTLEVLINNQPVDMQIDTGAAVSIMSEATYKQIFAHKRLSPPIEPTSMQLSTYSGEKLQTMGIITVEVLYQKQRCQLKLVIVKQPGPTLLGRDWLSHIKLDWPKITSKFYHYKQKR